MTSAQELHRLAALAAGHELKWSNEWPGGGCLMRRVVPEPEHPGSKWVPWRPLNDDGDALRLAVALNLGISVPVHRTIRARCHQLPRLCRERARMRKRPLRSRAPRNRPCSRWYRAAHGRGSDMTQIKERPILFSAEMVRAILGGRIGHVASAAV